MQGTFAAYAPAARDVEICDVPEESSVPIGNFVI